jgi:hypothetical protein
MRRVKINVPKRLIVQNTLPSGPYKLSMFFGTLVVLINVASDFYDFYPPTM